MSKDGFSSFIIRGNGSIFSEGLDEETATRVVRDALAPQVRAAVVEKLREVPAAVQVLGDLAVLLGGAVVLEARADGMSRLQLLVKLPDAPASSMSEAPAEAAPPAAARPPPRLRLLPLPRVPRGVRPGPFDEGPPMNARTLWAQSWRAVRTSSRSRATGYRSGTVILRLAARTLLGLRDSLMVCRRCGCDERHACPGGCWWAAYELCTSCAPYPAGPVRESIRAQARAAFGLAGPLSPPIGADEDEDGTGIRIFKLDRFGGCVDSLLIERTPEDDDLDDEADLLAFLDGDDDTAEARP